MMLAAASLICFRSAHHDHRIVVVGWLPVDEALCARGFFAADHADRVQLDHVVGTAEQVGHGPERLAAKVRVQPGQDDTNAPRGKLIHDGDNGSIEELRFVNGDDGCARQQQIEDGARLADRNRLEVLTVMRGYALKRVAESMAGLNTCTVCLAMVARRTRRISSSVLPLNMLPQITSTRPL